MIKLLNMSLAHELMKCEALMTAGDDMLRLHFLQPGVCCGDQCWMSSGGSARDSWGTAPGPSAVALL